MKKKISLLLCAIIIINTFMIKDTNIVVQAASSTNLSWIKNDTMDDLLQIVGNKAGDDEVLLNWDLLQFGNYELVYRLQDDTITKVKIRLDVDKMGIDYGIFKESTGDSLVQNLVNLSYYEMDYSLNVPVLINTPPVIVDIGGENYIHKEILKTSTNKYSGISFKLNNIDVRVKWNPQLNTVHFYTQGVEAGKIIEFGLHLDH
ncbi:MAG: uncharacterized protein K0R15_2438 [Clostridiales bacterium]|nr:uncharacterized protein [Clostridiales bacterium]